MSTCPEEVDANFCALQLHKELLDHQWVIRSHGPLLRPGQTTLAIPYPDPDVHPKGGTPYSPVPHYPGSAMPEDGDDEFSPPSGDQEKMAAWLGHVFRKLD